MPAGLLAAMEALQAAHSHGPSLLTCAAVRESAGNTWEGDFRSHGWYFSVEPFTGMTVLGHKPYQVRASQRVQQLHPPFGLAPATATVHLRMWAPVPHSHPHPPNPRRRPT